MVNLEKGQKDTKGCSVCVPLGTSSKSPADQPPNYGLQAFPDPAKLLGFPQTKEFGERANRREMHCFLLANDPSGFRHDRIDAKDLRRQA